MLLADLAKLLIPYDIFGFTGTRVGPKNDGGYIVPEQIINNTKVAYTYGVGNDVRFELDFVRRNPVTVHLYDHTITDLPESCRQFVFHKCGLADTKGECVDTFTNHLAANQDNDGVFLKIDVEGAEWPALAVSDLSSVICLVVEFHFWYGLTDLVRSVLAKLNGEFTLWHVHGNNYDAEMTDGALRVPRVLEATYVHNRFVASKSLKSQLPGSLDSPNRSDVSDHVLDWYVS